MKISVVCRGSLSVLGRVRGQTECDRANASGGRRLEGDFLRGCRRKATTVSLNAAARSASVCGAVRPSAVKTAIVRPYRVKILSLANW